MIERRTWLAETLVCGKLTKERYELRFAHEQFKSEKARHRQSPETHCSAAVLMERSSFRKGTLNVFLRRGAEPEIQVLRYRPVGE